MSTIHASYPAFSRRYLPYWIAGFATVLGACLCIYYWMFTRFSPWDDDGYLLIGIRSILKGHRLYDDIYTQYGPFYYLVYSLAHGLVSVVSGQPVSHDVQRYIGVALWIISALMWARTVYLVTDSLVWSGFGFFAGVKLLEFFPWSAGHPEEVCMALLAAIAMVACGFRPAAAKKNVALLACLVAAVTLTKVNAGIYVGLAIGLFLLRVNPPSRLRQAAEICLTIAALVLPVALMSSMMAVDWVRNYAVVATASIGAAILVAHRTQPELYLSGRIWWTAVLSFFACTVLVILPFYLDGTTLKALLQMTVLQHAGTARTWFVEAPIGSKVLVCMAISLCALAIVLLPMFRASLKAIMPRTRMAEGWAATIGWLRTGLLGLKIVVGLTCLYVLAKSSLPANHPTIFQYCVPFAWLILAEPSDDTARRTRSGRMALCFLAVFAYLYAYPVAGAQVLFASVPAGIAAIVILRDGTVEVANALPATRLTPRLVQAGPSIAFALLTVLFFSRDFYQVYRDYRENMSLALPGATSIRVEPTEVATYRWIARNVASCTALYSMPGQFSLNLWTSLESPTELTAGNWVGLLNPSQQRAVIRDLSRYPGLCIVYNPKLVELWRRGQDISRSPLAQYIRSEFVTVAASDGFFIMKRKQTAAPFAGQLTSRGQDHSN